MLGPINIWDLSLLITFISINLLVSIELLFPKSGNYNFLINKKRLKSITIIMTIVFFVTFSYRLMDILLSS